MVDTRSVQMGEAPCRDKRLRAAAAPTLAASTATLTRQLGRPICRHRMRGPSGGRSDARAGPCNRRLYLTSSHDMDMIDELILRCKFLAALMVSLHVGNFTRTDGVLCAAG